MSKQIENEAKTEVEAQERLLRLIKDRGAKPFSFDDLKANRGGWPQQESVDEFIAAVREWRHQGRNDYLGVVGLVVISEA